MYLTLSDLTNRFTLSRSTIYRLIKAGLFPDSVPLSPGRVAWRKEAIDEWESQQMRLKMVTGRRPS